jgi:hypothetical protein
VSEWTSLVTRWENKAVCSKNNHMLYASPRTSIHLNEKQGNLVSDFPSYMNMYSSSNASLFCMQKLMVNVAVI